MPCDGIAEGVEFGPRFPGLDAGHIRHDRCQFGFQFHPPAPAPDRVGQGHDQVLEGVDIPPTAMRPREPGPFGRDAMLNEKTRTVVFVSVAGSREFSKVDRLSQIMGCRPEKDGFPIDSHAGEILRESVQHLAGNTMNQGEMANKKLRRLKLLAETNGFLRKGRKIHGNPFSLVLEPEKSSGLSGGRAVG